MIVSIIVAIAKDNAIGRDNDLMWRLPKDMKFFRETTTGHHIITGRKNYISIPEKFRPLPDRTNIVITRDTTAQFEGAIVLHSIEDALGYALDNDEEEVFIIGGGEIYRQSLDIADRVYLTKVNAAFPDADTHFPELDMDDWTVSKENHYEADEKHAYDFSILTLDRIE